MEPNYGATDDEANTPLMEDAPLLAEKPRRGRAVDHHAVRKALECFDGGLGGRDCRAGGVCRLQRKRRGLGSSGIRG